MADYTDPGLAIKKLAANVRARGAGQDEAIARKVSAPTSGSGQLVYNATTGEWEAAPTGDGVKPTALTQESGTLTLTLSDGQKLTVALPAGGSGEAAMLTGGLRIRGGEANSRTAAKLPGKIERDYTYRSIAWYTAAYNYGVRLFRIAGVPSRTRGALLDEYMQHVSDVLDVGPDVQVMLDPMHCYGVDSIDGATLRVLGKTWSVADFAAQWGQIMSHATVKANIDRIIAVDVLNEPTTDAMTGHTAESLRATLYEAWQATVDTIRDTGYSGWILCQPQNWAKALLLGTNVPTWPFENDPKVAVCLHYYFDNSGTYTKTYAGHLADQAGEGFTDFHHKTDSVMSVIGTWQAAHGNAPVWMGELGWPPGTEWDTEGRYLMQCLNDASIPWIYDSLAADAAWQGTPPGAVEPFTTSDTTPGNDSPLDVVLDQGRAILAYIKTAPSGTESGGAESVTDYPAGYMLAL